MKLDILKIGSTCCLFSFFALVEATPIAEMQEQAPSSVTQPTEPGNRLSLDQAVSRVQRETGGHVLSAEVIQEKGMDFLRIKVLLPSGRVRVIYLDSIQ